MKNINSILKYETLFYFNSSLPKFFGVKFFCPYDIFELEAIAKREVFSIFEVGTGNSNQAKGITSVSGSFFCPKFDVENFDKPFDVELISYSPPTDARYEAKLLRCCLVSNENNKFKFVAATLSNWKKV